MKPTRGILTVAATGLALTSLWAFAAPRLTLAGSPDDKLSLSELVQAYFLAKAPDNSAALAASIVKASNGDPALIVDAMNHVTLWTRPDASQGSMVIVEKEADKPVEITYRVPAEYDPAKAYPLLFCQPEKSISAQQTIEQVVAWLRSTLQDFILVSPHSTLERSFSRPQGPHAAFPAVMNALRHRFHVDSDRVFLYGRNEGADAAWLLALMHGDSFAGVILEAGYPHVPYPEQTLSYLFENLRSLPIVTAWRDDPRKPASPRQSAAAAYNQAITEFARRSGLSITGFNLDQPPSAGADKFAAQASALLSNKRSWPPVAVSKWFRYPDQGSTAWLKQVDPEGPVWLGDQISILPATMTDRDEFVNQVVQEHLARLDGRIEPDEISVTSKGCARIDVLVPYKLINKGRNPSIRCNGQVRHQGPIVPSIPEMLETARHNWEFQHLFAARFSLSVRPRNTKP